MKKEKFNKQKANGIKPDVKRSASKPRYWVCIIGDTEHAKLPHGADLPMRNAVGEQFKKVTGHYAENNWSGWSADKKTVNKILKAWS